MIHAEIYVSKSLGMLPMGGSSMSLEKTGHTLHGVFMITPAEDAKLLPGEKVSVTRSLVSNLDWCYEHGGDILHIPLPRNPKSNIEIKIIVNK